MNKRSFNSSLVAAFCYVMFVLLPTTGQAAECLRYEYYLHWSGSSNLGAVGTAGYDVAISGELAVVSAFESGIRILDISIPDFPTILSSVDTVGNVTGIAVDGSRAVLSGGIGHGISIVDIADPSAPSVDGQLALPGEATDVDVVGNFAYVACGSAGMKVVDISTSASPVVVGEFAAPGLFDVTVTEDTAFLTSGGVLRLVDVSNPSTPVQLGAIALADYAYETAVRGNYAYVTTGAAGLQVVDIQNPATPVVIGAVATPGAWGVSLSGDIAYVSDQG